MKTTSNLRTELKKLVLEQTMDEIANIKEVIDTALKLDDDATLLSELESLIKLRKNNSQEVPNDSEIIVNKIELASEIAHNQLLVDWGKTRGGMYKDENAAITEYSEEAQDLFNEFYDNAITLIEKCR